MWRRFGIFFSGSLLLLLAVVNSVAAPFQNLDFEQANTNTVYTDV